MTMAIGKVLTGCMSAMALCLLMGSVPTPDQDAKTKEAPKYLGAGSCKKCHRNQHKSWKKTNMAKAFDVLKPGQRAEQKKKQGLDPKKDYTKDKTCLPCHTVGFGKPGGYEIPPQGDSTAAKKAQKRSRALEGVQCESCHGPASLVVAHKKDENWKWKDVAAKAGTSGMEFPTKDTCTQCHNPDSPFVGKDYKFDFEKRKDEGTHRHYKMDVDHGCGHTHVVTKKKKKK